MSFDVKNTGTAASLILAVLALGACDDAQQPTEPTEGLDPIQSADHTVGELADADPVGRVAGRTIQDITATLEDGRVFDGRIVGLQFEEYDDEHVLASGRLVGELNGERINEAFEDVLLGVDYIEENGNPNGVTQILFLELGPIFLDVLGLIVEVPDPIVVEIRAEEGPGQLLGNLLVALLGILDP